ncbi:uncharacterized protein LOC144357824 [Saccoglossus kowalevskii]
MLPEYTPASYGAHHNGVRENVITDYFNACYSNQEILASLALCHGIVISLRHLKRLLRKIGLRRRQTVNLLHLDNVLEAIQQELNGSGKCIGYRSMWKRLKLKYGLAVNRDIVLELLRLVDPDGIERRKKRRMMRRKYIAPGPNFIWHIDGYDKLKPFGFAVHGAIDGFSRRILLLEVSLSNNNPAIVAHYYLDCVRQTGFVPRVIRCDFGTENSTVASLQSLFRWDDSDDLAGVKSIMYGKSTSNQLN